MLEFTEINQSNWIAVNQVKPGPEERSQIHYNAYWYGQAGLHNDIWAYLITRGDGQGEHEPIGFIAFGVCYEDEYLIENRHPEIGELYHLVIDPDYQGNGYGEWAVNECIDRMAQYGCVELRVAHNPDNKRAGEFYKKFGFEEFGKNYDGDPYLVKSIQ